MSKEEVIKKQDVENHSLEFEFIPYEEALALKELGFDEECFGFFDDIDDDHELFLIRTQTWNAVHNLNKHLTRAPLYQQAFRWFRDVHDLDFTVINIRHKTYEEAELACLRKLIDLVNQNKEDEFRIKT